MYGGLVAISSTRSPASGAYHAPCRKLTLSSAWRCALRAATATSRRTVTASLLALSHASAPGALAMTGGDVAARGLRLLQPTPRSRGQLAAVTAALALVLAVPLVLIAGPGLSAVASDHHPEVGHNAATPNP